MTPVRLVRLAGLVVVVGAGMVTVSVATLAGWPWAIGVLGAALIYVGNQIAP